MQVTLLEQHEVAYGASGRNPGFVWLHCRNPGWALEVSLAGRALVRRPRRGSARCRSSSGPRAGSSISRRPSRASCSRSSSKTRHARRARHGADRRCRGARLVGPIRPDVLGASFCPTTPRSTRRPSSPRSRPGHGRGRRHPRGRRGDGAGRERRRRGRRRDQRRPHQADVVVIATGAWTRQLLGRHGITAADRHRAPAGARHAPAPLDIQPVVYGPLAAKQYACSATSPSWDADAFLAPDETEAARCCSWCRSAPTARC